MPTYKRQELLTTLKHIGTLLVDSAVADNDVFMRQFGMFNVVVISIDGSVDGDDEWIATNDVAALLTNRKGVFEGYFTVVLVQDIEFRYPFIYGWVSVDIPVVEGVSIRELREAARANGHVTSSNDGSADILDGSMDSVNSAGMTNVVNGVNEMLLAKSDRPLLDLLITKRERPTQRNMQTYIQHVKRCALSLFMDGLGKDIFKRRSSTHKKMSKREQDIIRENERRLQEISEKKENEYLRAFYEKYLGMDVDERARLLSAHRTTDGRSSLVRRRMTLLRIENSMDRWNMEKRKECVNEGVLVDVYVNCLEYCELPDRKKEEMAYVEDVMRETGFGATIDEIISRDSANENAKGKRAGKEGSRMSSRADGKMSGVSRHADKSRHIGKKGKENDRINSSAGSENEHANKHTSKKDSRTDNKVCVSDWDVYFQLKHAGDRLKRTLKSTADDRTTFMVDSWQKTLLDIVDSNKSCVISAPTASGKTFICFYAIEKAITDGTRLIFCVPTKALVNQVVADILIRFNERCKCGIVMSDYQINADSNVIVTVPMMLEGLLEEEYTDECSSKNARSINSKDTDKIRNRIKVKHNHRAKSINRAADEQQAYTGTTVIIDEIHKINSDEMSTYIERCIHKVRGPLIALSATLGDDNRVYEWIRRVEHAKGKQCMLVEHSERYCDLRYYYYNGTMNDMSIFIGHNASSMDSMDSMVDVMMPEDVLRMYYAVYEVIRDMDSTDSRLDMMKSDYKQLRFSTYFDSNILTKQDVRGYARTVYQYMEKYGIVNEVMDMMNSETEEAFRTKSSIEDVNKLVREIKRRDMVPCIVFNMERECVNRMAVALYEDVLRENENVRDMHRKRERRKEKDSRKENGKSNKDEWIEESIREEEMSHRVVVRSDYMISRISDTELDDMLGSIRVPAIFKKMVYYGIGVHHNGMNKKYREIVEILFRSKHIGILFSTHTLSLGINMPCRTVIFAGDSTRLDSINIMQMSGRAGRRGHDTIGHVIFIGIDGYRIRRLMRRGESVCKRESMDVYGMMWFNERYILSMVMNKFIDYYTAISHTDSTRSTISNTDSTRTISNIDSNVIGCNINSVCSTTANTIDSNIDSTRTVSNTDNNVTSGTTGSYSHLVDEIVSMADSIRTIIGSDMIDSIFIGSTRTDSNTVSTAMDRLSISKTVSTHDTIREMVSTADTARQFAVHQFVSILLVLVSNQFMVVHDGRLVRSKWGDVLLFNEMCDPLLLLVMIRNGVIDTNSMDSKEYMLTICHFIEVKHYEHVNKQASDGDVLPAMPKRITQYLSHINRQYPAHLRIGKHVQSLPAYLHYVHVRDKDAYMYNFYVHGRKGCLHVPMGELWQRCYRMERLLKSMCEVVSGDGRRVVRDVYEVFKCKFSELHA